MAKVQNDFSSETFAAAGRALANIGRALEGHRSLSVDVVGLSIRGPQTTGGEHLVVIRGLDGEGVPVVSFHSAFTVTDAIRGVEDRLANGSLKWRVDELKT